MSSHTHKHTITRRKSFSLSLVDILFSRSEYEKSLFTAIVVFFGLHESTSCRCLSNAHCFQCIHRTISIVTTIPYRKLVSCEHWWCHWFCRHVYRFNNAHCRGTEHIFSWNGILFVFSHLRTINEQFPSMNNFNTWRKWIDGFALYCLAPPPHVTCSQIDIEIRKVTPDLHTTNECF